MFLPLIQRPTPPKQWNCASPAPPSRLTFPPYYPPLQPPVFGWLLRLKSSTGGHLRPRCILYYIFFVDQFAAPNNGMVSPHALRAQRASALTPPYRFRQLSGWLLFKIPKRRPPKARARRISLFFHAPYSDAPIDGTGNGESTPNTPRLLQTHRERRRQDLGQWQILPWRERTEATGG